MSRDRLWDEDNAEHLAGHSVRPDQEIGAIDEGLVLYLGLDHPANTL
jgi:hypothetical protein